MNGFIDLAERRQGQSEFLLAQNNSSRFAAGIDDVLQFRSGKFSQRLEQRAGPVGFDEEAENSAAGLAPRGQACGA